MGKRYSKQAWISREGPEGDCVIETTNPSTGSQATTEEMCKAPSSHTADFTYKGYPVNLKESLFERHFHVDRCPSVLTEEKRQQPYKEKEEPFEVEKSKKCLFYDDYPLEVVELPDLPDGKKIELRFDREGLVEASTQTTKPVKEPNECGMSVKSTGSDHLEWSYTLYDFEGKGQVSRDDLKNLVKSIYEVLGKSVHQSKTHPKDPLKKLKIRLSVSKERGKANDTTEPASCHEYVISAVTSQDHSKKTRKGTFHIERCDSMTVNPPSPDSLMNIDKIHSTTAQEKTPADGLDKHCMQKTVCRRCDQGRRCKQTTVHESMKRNPESKANYHCPKRMQTGPGDCNPPSPREMDLCRVRDWLSKICEPHDGHELERIESRHRHSRKSRHTSCRQEPWEHDYELHKCPQYLDLATDHATYPYHVQSHACLYSNSPRLQRRSKHSKSPSHNCKQRDQSCPNRRTIVHQHEHHHHHSHHHYHHYVE